MRNRSVNVFLLFLLSMIVLWILCPVAAKFSDAADGHLPSQGPNSQTPSSIPPATSSQVPEEQPFYYYYSQIENKPDLKLSMHVLEIEPNNPDVLVMPVSSHETLFGYAYLSEMNQRWNAKASVNGGFSHTNGLLGGLYALKEELLTPATGKYPVLFLKDGKAFIEDVKSSVWLEEREEGNDMSKTETGTGDKNKINLDNLHFNQYPKGEGLYIFTPSYGSENRIEVRHLNAVISNGEVRGLTLQNSSYEIPEDGFLVTAIGKAAEARLQATIKPGMWLETAFEISSLTGKITGYDWAYECGSWILKNGEIVVPTADTWVGTLRTRAPRTAVGIKENGNLVFVVADGRQESSDGLTGEELAQKLLDLGIRDAVNLDGGASSEMIIEGSIVNRPSAGRERMLACSFVVLERK